MLHFRPLLAAKKPCIIQHAHAHMHVASWTLTLLFEYMFLLNMNMSRSSQISRQGRCDAETLVFALAARSTARGVHRRPGP